MIFYLCRLYEHNFTAKYYDIIYLAKLLIWRNTNFALVKYFRSTMSSKEDIKIVSA